VCHRGVCLLFSPTTFSSMLISHGLRSLHVLTILWLIDCDDCGLFFPSSLAPHSVPEKSSRSLIYGHRFGINRPMDLNALLLCAWMMSEGCSCQPSTSVVFPCLIVGIAPSNKKNLCVWTSLHPCWFISVLFFVLHTLRASPWIFSVLWLI
jgi:hypothetical protein